MPGLNLTTELQLYKKKLEEIISEINFQNKRIMLKQIFFAAQDLILYHIDSISNLLEEIEDLDTLTSIQQEKAKMLLEPFQGLAKLEQMIEQVRKNSADESTQIHK